MGEVYRAKDTKLHRDVALKVLPESFIHDPERVARFRREAHLLASINHPTSAGTFARRVRWSRVEAPPARTILELAPRTGIVAFEWSGRNRLSARLWGSDQLAALTDSLRSHSLGSPLLAVAHSHGGNLVRWLPATVPLDAAVYVNTAFIHLLTVSRSPLRLRLQRLSMAVWSVL